MNKKKCNIASAILGIDSVPSIRSILETICLNTGMGLGVIAYVNEKEWIACSIWDSLNTGLRVGQPLNVDYTICSEIYDHHIPIIITDIERCTNSRWKQKLTKRGFKSYLSFPILTPDGMFAGTLCTLDYKVADIDENKIRPLFKLLSELITFHLSTIYKLENTEIQLKEEIGYSKRRDRLLSILGHDLNNPLSAVITLSQFLSVITDNPKHKKSALLIYDSATRMKGLVNNILDFTKGKLAGGISIQKVSVLVERIIVQTLNELSIAFPNRAFTTDLRLKEPVRCDSIRMAQVFSNIISNAFKYGKIEETISIKSFIDNGRFFFIVENHCKPIPSYILKNIFKPFVSQKDYKGEGLGLGLYITKEIANAHEGDIEVRCQNGKVMFKFWIPV